MGTAVFLCAICGKKKVETVDRKSKYPIFGSWDTVSIPAIFEHPLTSKVNNMATKKKKAAKKAAPKKAAKKAAKRPAKKAAKKKSARKPNPAFMRPLTPSNALSAVVGSKAIPRTEVVKKMWVYIKANRLQDKNNKRMINADDKLKPVFGGKSQVSMFDMAKHLGKHLS
jgi:upstream activation factor subunit UAF30